MNTLTLSIAALSFLVGPTTVKLCSGETINFTLTTKLLNTMSLTDSLVNEYLENKENVPNAVPAVRKYLKDNEPKPVLPKMDKIVKNL